MNRLGLPPLVGAIDKGEITWRRIEGVDHEVLGYLLACHLIIEHYITEALKSTTWPGEDLNWHAGRLSFSQKVSILSSVKDNKFRDLVPCIRRLNALRNKFSHDISFRLTDAHLAPFVRFLTEISQVPDEIPHGVTKILEIFTGVACAYFAGYISSLANLYKLSRQ